MIETLWAYILSTFQRACISVPNPRTPIWAKDIHQSGFLQEHWFWCVIAVAAALAGLFFHYASRLPDELLFYLKLFSFSATGLLGVVGIITDFKDENKKLTAAGKLNLAGLIFAAVIGVAAQKSENDKAKQASDKREEEYQALLKRTDQTIEQVERGFEAGGDSFQVVYELNVGVDYNNALWNSVVRKLRTLPAGDFRTYDDAHTHIQSRSQNFSATFDEMSELVPQVIQKSLTTTAPQRIELFKNAPNNAKTCHEQLYPEFSAVFDREISMNNLSASTSVESLPTGVFQNKYFSGSTYILQHARPSYKIVNSPNQIHSNRDFSEMYMRFYPEKEFRFQRLVLIFGKRVVDVDLNERIEFIDKCTGKYVDAYQLPKFSDSL